eukprot:TRINITY_DN18402_c0_g1_i1.p1 TRINITY_DN18402_c0_g1~~TRINITY_DN18402_c0_g1_i1.p1  ORF type:complete len:225 (-),score=25.92 TRINITY_DN18402_c0_g1_i1:90-686(-)
MNNNGCSGDYEVVSKDFTTSECRQAAHVLVFARTKEKLWSKHDVRAKISMHMRFDGKLGFPGGLIDEGEDVETGLNREFKEEMGLELGILKTDWISTHYSQELNIIVHFYCKEFDPDRFNELETSAMKAEEYGIEILGNIRVPLYTYKTKRGVLAGLPQFLRNNFAGNARQQLLSCLVLNKILTQEEVDTAMEQSQSI